MGWTHYKPAASTEAEEIAREIAPSTILDHHLSWSVIFDNGAAGFFSEAELLDCNQCEIINR